MEMTTVPRPHSAPALSGNTRVGHQPSLPAQSFSHLLLHSSLMSMTLQTLLLRPPMATGAAASRRHRHALPLPPPATRLHSAPPSLTAKPLLFSRLAAAGSDQADSSGDREGAGSGAVPLVRWFLDLVATNIIPFSLISGIILGLANPTLGCIAHRWSLPKFSTFGIFFISGLTLRSREIGAAVEAWPAGMFGLGSILLLTPLFSKLILQIHLDPQEFITGLAIFCCMPTTLSTGIALTQLVGGNSALALAMTVMSNMLCIVTVPYSLTKFVGAGTGVSVPTMYLLRSLVITLVVPLILGKVLRDSLKSVADYVDQNRRLFSVISAIFLGLVPWVQVSRSRSYFMTTKPTVFGIAISMGVLLHLILLALNTVGVKSLAVVSGGSKSVFANKQNARAVVIVASQKTLPVLVAVVEQLRGSLGEPGLLVLPCVASHIIQVIIDSFIVNWWLRKDRLETESKEV